MNKDITLEDLGYEKYEKHDDDGDYIEYYKEKIHDSITFYYDKSINIDCLCNVRVLQAIYNECKDLGWLDE